MLRSSSFGPCVFSPVEFGGTPRSGVWSLFWSTRPVLALAAASQMGTPQEDESIFAILVAGETPNNLHQDKLGEYVR